MNKLIGTIMYFWGAIVRVENMYIPRTISLTTFLALVIYIIYNIITN